MTLSIVRFAVNGWIYEFYVEPEFHFTFYGFDWVKPLPETGMYLIFVAMGMAAFCILLGLFYRYATVMFFLLFTYVELIDKTYYLNHYYFISVISFLLIWLPANKAYSLDVQWRGIPAKDHVSAWTINVLKLQLGIVYFYAGVAKISPEWLWEALPLKIWLPARGHFPLIGEWLTREWVAYFFSWTGMLYDLFIPFLLLASRTRPYAYLAVIFFHVMTWLLFPIGMFPFIMIGLTLIFFSSDFHAKLLSGIGLKKSVVQTLKSGTYKPASAVSLGLTAIMVLHFTLQILFPLRSLLYPGKLFWTEEGYRFSWRVMLMEKAGMCTFFIKQKNDETPRIINNSDHLTYLQERMMATQPDMILQFAHYLKEIYGTDRSTPDVFVESLVTLQGNRSRVFVDPAVNLAEVERSWKPKKWILPFEKAH